VISESGKMSALTELYKDISVCKRCNLYKYATKAVPGEGSETARIMFIGEAPGWHEDQQGRPFVGPAGKFLDKLLASIDLKREDVYIANVVKHRPPENREPLPVEITACSTWLDHQLEIIRPKVIVTLGRYSMARFFPDKTIGKIHGTWEKRNGIIYFAMYHPAAALHQQNLRYTLEQDMLKLPALVAEASGNPDPKPEVKQEPKQLSMF
jgi:uracil-DNA glycosylase